MSAKRTEWLEVDFDDANDDDALSDVLGVCDVEVSASPYDLPDAVRGEYDEEQRKFVIEFRYISTEKAKETIILDEHASAEVGRKSKRLYKLFIDVEKMRVETVKLTLKSVNSLLEQKLLPHHSAPTFSDHVYDNLHAASKAINERWKDLAPVAVAF